MKENETRPGAPLMQSQGSEAESTEYHGWPRRVLIHEGVLDHFGHVEWGEPDAEGFYTPTISDWSHHIAAVPENWR